MKTNRIAPILAVILVLLVIGVACTGPATAEPTVIPPTDTPLPTATPTKAPTSTSTPRPTATPNLQATEQAEEVSSLIDSFAEKGYVSTADGEYIELDPFKEDWAQIGWYQWWTLKDPIADFVFKAHFEWSTASETPEISGCGILFGLQENRDHYGVFLDRSRILFLMKRGSNVYSVGKTRGSGRVSFGNPAAANFAISVKGQSAYVSVDGEFTEYTLSMDQTTSGRFAFTLLSGTNKSYGTRCEMTDIILWTPE